MGKDRVPAVLNEINIKLTIEYNGKNYLGWQRQKNKPSIQQTIEDSLQVLFPKDKIKLNGAGRTDAGVHALNQVANFRLNAVSMKNFSMNKLEHSLNSILPSDITIKKAAIVTNNFHSRYSARKRIYKYLISTEKRSYDGDKYFLIKTKFDIDLAVNYCKLLIGLHSFRGLCKNKEDKHDFMCEVFSANVKETGKGTFLFTISANRFLHSMVRAVVGVMLKIASSKITLTEFKNKFNKGEDIKIQFVPANALILYKIIY